MRDSLRRERQCLCPAWLSPVIPDIHQRRQGLRAEGVPHRDRGLLITKAWRGQVNWGSSRKAKVRPSPVVWRAFCAYAVSGWRKRFQSENQKGLLLPPSFSGQPHSGGGGQTSTALQLPGRHQGSLLSQEKAAFHPVNWQNTVSPQSQSSSSDVRSGTPLSRSLRVAPAVARAGTGLGKEARLGAPPASTRGARVGLVLLQGSSDTGPQTRPDRARAWARSDRGETLALRVLV